MEEFLISRRGLLVSMVAGGAGIATTASAARPRRGRALGSWEFLGARTVTLQVDHDRIDVGRQHGLFRHLQLRVRENAVYITDLRINFENGQKQDARVRALIPAGGSTRQIDFTGRGRYIDSIDLTYRSAPTGAGRAVVEAWGQR